MHKTRNYLLIALFAINNYTYSQNRSATLLPEKIPIDRDVKIGELPNGFKYYLRKTEASAGKTAMYFIVKAGTLYEDEKQLGLAHLVEHMGFRGLKHWPNGIYDHFLSQGLERGRDINAWTGPTMTNYYLMLPPNRPDLIRDGLQVARDWADGMMLNPKEVNTERSAIRAEGLSSESTNRKMSEFNARLLKNPNYKPDNFDRTQNNFLTFDHSQIVKFYRKWYTANRQALIVVGDIDVKQVEQDIVKMFSGLKKGGSTLNDASIVSKWAVKLDGRNTTLQEVKEQSNGVEFQIYSKIPSRIPFLQKRTVGDYKTGVIDKLYEELMNYRFMVDLAGSPEVSISSSVQRSVFIKAAQLDALYAFIRIGRVKNIEQDLKKGFVVIERIKRFGFDSVELRRAKQLIERQLVKRINPSNKELAAKYIDNFGFGSAAPSTTYEVKLLQDVLKSISLEEINKMARDWISQRENVDMVISAPKEVLESLGSTQIERWIREVEQSDIKPLLPCEYCDPVPVGLTKLNNPDNTQQSVIDNAVSASLMEYEENGMRIILKRVSSAGPLFFQAFRQGGYSLYTGADRVIGMRIEDLARTSGVGGMDDTMLKRYLWGYTVSAVPYIKEFEEGFVGYADGNDGERAFQLMNLYIRNPNRNETAFKSWIDRELEKIKLDSVKHASMPSSAGQRQEAILTKKDIMAIGFDRTYEVFHEMFNDMRGYTLVVSGNFDPAKVKAYVSQYLTLLNNSTDSSLKLLNSKRKAQVRDKDGQVGLNFSGLCQYDYLKKVQIEVLAAYLNLRLSDKLRNEEGLVYSVSAFASLSRDAKYQVSINCINTPGVSKDILKMVFEEIERLKVGNLDSNLVARAIVQVKTKHQANIQSGQYWNNYLTDAVRFHDEKSITIDIDKLIDNVQAKDIVSAARDFLIY